MRIVRDIRYLKVFPDHFEPRLLHVRPEKDFFCLRTCNFKKYSVSASRQRHWFSVSKPDIFNYDDLPQLNFVVPHIFADEVVPVQIRHQITPTALPAYIIPRYYAAISDADGRVEIAGLEANRKMKYQLFHPDLGTAFAKTIFDNRLIIDETGSFELTLQEGINDVGEIDISKAADAYITSLWKTMP